MKKFTVIGRWADNNQAWVTCVRAGTWRAAVRHALADSFEDSDSYEQLEILTVLDGWPTVADDLPQAQDASEF